MSDFDKFFAEKMEEEGDFPRRDRNWRQLSQRLDAFQDGGQHQSWYRRYPYWLAAAAVTGLLCLSVTGWAFWKIQTLQNENAALLRQLIELQKARPTPIVPLAQIPATNKFTPVTETNPVSTVVPPATPGGNRSSLFTLHSSLPPAPALNTTKAVDLTNFSTEKSHKDNVLSKQIAQPDHSTVPTTVSSKSAPPSKENQPGTPDTPARTNTGSPTALPSITSAENRSNLPETDAARVNTSAFPADSSQVTPGMQQTELGQVLVKPTDTSTTTPTVEKSLGNTANSPIKRPDTIATAPAILPASITPVRRTGRIGLGVEGVAALALPQEKGISPMLGAGVTASYAFLPALRITATADWLHFDVSTTQYLPKFHTPHHAPHVPMHPQHPQDELVQVESEQRQQHYALGLAYVLPIGGRLRPVIRLAHDWVHISPALVSFKFEEPGHGGGGHPGPGGHDPDYIVQKFNGETLDNNWRFGAGLEYVRGNLAFILGVDYTKSFTAGAESTFDAVSVRGGVQYKFD